MDNVFEHIDLDFEVSAEQSGERLDSIIAAYLGEFLDSTLQQSVPSRSKVAAWISDSLVRVNTLVRTKASFRPKEGDLVQFTIPPPKTMSLEPDRTVPIDVVFEDDSVLVINKPPGVVVHPGAGNYHSTLVHGLLHYLGDDIRQIGDSLRPGIVHRLDMDTSGLMVIAKTERAFQGLAKQFLPPRTISRNYMALTFCLPKTEACSAATMGDISLPISRHRTRRTKMAVAAAGEGRSARTHWKLSQRLAHGCLLELSLETGRTHQVRVHLSATGAPIVGDPLYGSVPQQVPKPVRDLVRAFGRQALHASSLSFIHPLSNERVLFEAPMPLDLIELISVFS